MLALLAATHPESIILNNVEAQQIYKKKKRCYARRIHFFKIFSPQNYSPERPFLGPK
jgi:hypothetical protein